MKIPDTSANVGAYYGNEEGGQWQPNGVIIDSGVGGGVVGSGDAGIHRPPVYPVHIPRGHIPGYVMAGAFYPPAPFAAPAPAPADDFEDYMWMENEEEFDKQVMQQLEEEALMEQCIEAMLEDEQREQRTRAHNGHYPTTSNGNPLSLEETVSRSTLNPLAAEFVPTARPAPPQPTPTATPTQATAPPAAQDAPPTQHFCTNKEEDTESMVAQPPSEDETDARTDADTPPETEVSESASRTDAGEAPAEAEAGGDKRPKPDKRDAKAKDAKKPVVKQAEVKPKAVRPDTRPAKRTPAPRREDDAPVPKPTPPTEESSPVPAGPKPINYAAAARANKPKPKTAPAPAAPAPTPAPKSDKKEKPKVDKPVQRKNSTK